MMCLAVTANTSHYYKMDHTSLIAYLDTETCPQQQQLLQDSWIQGMSGYIVDWRSGYEDWTMIVADLCQ